MEKSDKKKNTVLVVIMVVAIIGTLWFVLRDEDRIEFADDLDNIFNSGVRIPGQAEIDVFSSETFKSLEDYSNKDLLLEPRGKENPFKPFDITPKIESDTEPDKVNSEQ